jgi:hypothetical protein
VDQEKNRAARTIDNFIDGREGDGREGAISMASPMDIKKGLKQVLTTNRAASTINDFTDGCEGALSMTSHRWMTQRKGNKTI